MNNSVLNLGSIRHGKLKKKTKNIITFLRDMAPSEIIVFRY